MSVFDEIVPRSGTDSLKWQKYAGRDIIPMWVADMDFQAPPAILKALHHRIDHGVFGYGIPTDNLVEELCSAISKRYRWDIDPSWIIWLPGLVTGLNLACRSIGDIGDAVISTVPIYPPFLTAPVHSQRQLVTVRLGYVNGAWQLDMEELENVRTKRTKLFLHCNPHNPTGHVFSRTQLEELGQYCLQNNIVICSDEIHCDLILDNVEHQPMATLSNEIRDISITLMAPSKTFNMPGLACSFAIIPNPRIRTKFKRNMAGIVPEINLLGYSACLAAYKEGDPWLKSLVNYLRKNRDLVMHTVNHELPGINAHPIQATYLAWLDTRERKLKDPVRFFEECGVGLSDGRYFGEEGFVRLNFGCPKKTLIEALTRMKNALAY